MALSVLSLGLSLFQPPAQEIDPKGSVLRVCPHMAFTFDEVTSDVEAAKLRPEAQERRRRRRRRCGQCVQGSPGEDDGYAVRRLEAEVVTTPNGSRVSVRQTVVVDGPCLDTREAVRRVLQAARECEVVVCKHLKLSDPRILDALSEETAKGLGGATSTYECPVFPCLTSVEWSCSGSRSSELVITRTLGFGGWPNYAAWLAQARYSDKSAGKIKQP